MRRTSWQRARWALTAVVLCWSCGGLQRKPSWTVGGDLAHGQPEIDARGCDEYSSAQRHRQTSASAHARYEGSDGLVFMARVRGVLGERLEVKSYQGREPPALGRYGLLSAGAAVGADGARAGLDFGMAFVRSAADDQALMYAQLRLGNPNRAWFALTGGTLDPAFYLRLASAGLGARSERVRLHAAVAATQALVPLSDERLTASGLGDRVMIGVELDLHLKPTPATPWALEVGGLLSNLPTGRVGLSYQF